MKPKFLLLGLGLLFFTAIVLFLLFLNIPLDQAIIENEAETQHLSTSNNHQGTKDPSVNNNNPAKANKGAEKVDSSVNIHLNTSLGSSKVDQTLLSDSLSEKSGKTTDATKEVEAELEADLKPVSSMSFKLIDGEKNVPISNYSIKLVIKFLKKTPTVETFQTDENGIFTFRSQQKGWADFQIHTAGYAVSICGSFMSGEEFQMIKLFKGGRVEVKVTSSKPLHKLVADIGGLKSRETFTWLRSRQPTDEGLEMAYNKEKDIFFLENLPIGSLDIRFQSPNFEVSETYKIFIESQKNTQIEIELVPTRTISIELNIEEPPKAILVEENKNVQGSVLFTDNVRTEVFASASGDKDSENIQYQYEIPTEDLSAIIVYVDGYLPETVKLEPHQNNHRLTLQKGYQGEVLVQDVDGTPISGATVQCVTHNFLSEKKEHEWGSLDQWGSILGDFSKTTNLRLLTATTNDDGIALFEGLPENTKIRLSASHSEYKTTNANWNFDIRHSNTKILKMTSGYTIFGKVTSHSKPVENIEIRLFKEGRRSVATSHSLRDGSYSLNRLELEKTQVYHVEAYHKDYGVAVVPLSNLDTLEQEINLELKEEEQRKARLVDTNKVPLPFKELLLSYRGTKRKIQSDKDGFFEMPMSIESIYGVTLIDADYQISLNTFQAPKPITTFIVEKKPFKRIHISLSNGKTFTGLLNVSYELGIERTPLEVRIDENGHYYVVIDDLRAKRALGILFEAEGYAPIRVTPNFRVPKEFTITFQESEPFTVTVLDAENGQSIVGAVVEVFHGGYTAQKLSTNKNGQVIFTNLIDNINPIDEINLMITKKGYSAYASSLEGINSKATEINLLRGGGVRGNLTFSDEFSYVQVTLSPNGKLQQALKKNSLILSAHRKLPIAFHSKYFDTDGDFEFSNLIPGEYNFEVLKHYKTKNRTPESIKRTIVIENNKTLELNLDQYK